MNSGPVSPMPWDIVVFLTITTVGFGFSVQRVVQQQKPATSASYATSETTRSIAATVSQKTLDLGCLERRVNGEKLTSSDASIRIKGRFCHLTRKMMRRFDGVRIKNLTNGNEGTIFFRGYDTSFVTDYLALSAGRNTIQVEWKEAKGSDPKVVTAEIIEQP